MQDFLNKVGKTASSAASKAGNKANELIGITKLKSKISSERHDIEAVKTEIGEYCYELFKVDKIEDDKIKEFCEKIKTGEAAITELQQQIEDIKEEYKDK